MPSLTKTSATVERADPLLLAQLIKAEKGVAEAMVALSAARGAVNFVKNELNERHSLHVGDAINKATGVIIRAKG